METLVLSLLLILAGIVLSTILYRTPKTAGTVGAIASVAGSIAGLVASLSFVFSRTGELLFSLPFDLPFGELTFRLDALSAFFLIPINILCGLSAIYGIGYMKSHQNETRYVWNWVSYNLLFLSMILVVIADNALFFLVAWELMALSSFFLVSFDSGKKSVQKAGVIYLIATHLGTMALFFFFLFMARDTGSMSLNEFGRLSRFVAHPALLFGLALVGFGAKAGIVPLHVWLPEAHPAAPSHVSAVMSGVMIKTGIYGIIRAVMWLSPLPYGWGAAIIVIGAVSGILGVLFAIAQHDLKRLLAYHSVENIGIILIGTGVGVTGVSSNMPVLVYLGFGGALLHTLNHSLFKGLLFLGAGSVQRGTGTLNIESMGGLLRRMPFTGFLFLVGSASICGLPPFNGFISEFMIYAGSFAGLTTGFFLQVTALLTAIVSLSVIGGLAVLCFTKVFGIAFLGEPRGEHSEQAKESPRTMLLPMMVLAGLCLLIGLLPFILLRVIHPALISISMSISDIPMTEHSIGWLSTSLSNISIAAVVLILAIALFAVIRRRLLKGRTVSTQGTWDCGYAEPTARMQYTASSFAEPVSSFAAIFLATHTDVDKPVGLFPVDGSFASHSTDMFMKYLWLPVFGFFDRLFRRLSAIERGNMNLHLLYVAVALILLLFWKLRQG